MVVELNRLLDLVVEKRASDLHLTVGVPPTIRLHGHLRPLKLPSLTNDDTVAFMRSITSERHQQELKERGGCDFGFAYEQKARFRVAVYMQKGMAGLALRLIPTKLLSFDDIGLPPSVKNLLFRPRGLILVTGPTGSGKTTTLATMIDFINTEEDCHIITIEDPIEYFHNHKKSIVTQRELGVDVGSFSEAIRRALRMDPDVVLVGEMRDLETIQTAITAAETGHLVFGTLHTTGAGRTINRIIDAFPQEQQEQIRAQLSTSIVAVISQMLLPRADKEGIIAAFEILIMTSAIEHLIRENQTHKIVSAIQTGAKQGMVLLDDFLFDLFIKKKIGFQEMMQAAQQPNDLQQKVMEYTQTQAAAAAKANRG
ncbi:MAG: type IV pilus twitching motility protein PilT [Candidatus Brocadiae bacterium]|nr:type IV pilus twitching motility protein PilT [Candidatus Brocadiia bacterium]